MRKDNEQGVEMTIRKRKGIVEKKERATSPIVRPIRTTAIKRPGMSDKIFSSLAIYFPKLKDELIMAGIKKTPEEFIKLIVMNTIIYSLLTLIITIMVFMMLKISYLWLIPLVIIIPIFYFYFWKYYPKVKIKQRERRIDKDLVFAGRHLVIALRSGVPLFDAMVGLTQDYGKVSREFNKIVERITLGEPPTQAIRHVVKYNPSKYFNRMALQIVNALNSGADLSKSLDAVLEQIAQEQIISLKEYGQKLNPLSMFYMLFAIVFPSLGIVFITVLMSFTGGGLATLGVGILVIGAVYILFAQLLFITMVESSRPPYELT